MDASSETIEDDGNQCPQCGGAIAARPSGSADDLSCPHCGHLLWFLRRTVDGVLILTFLPGLITGRESIDRVDEVAGALGDSPRILLDLSALRFLSSLFLGMLVRLHLRTASEQKTMKICGLRPEAIEVFRVTKLDKVFDLHADLPGALKSYG